MPTKLTRSRLRLAAVTAVVVVASLGGPTAAQANTTGGAISGTALSSDPEIFTCPRSSGSGNTLCLYTSHDIGTGALPNYYPMDKTYLYRLKDGADASVPANWTGTQILDESQLPCGRVGIACGAHHLWAPGGRWVANQSKYLLYVPDLMDTSADGQHNASRIQVLSNSSTSGTSTYTQLGFMQNMPPSPNTGYASDPFLFVDTAQNYLVWANGDFDNCGGVSMGRLVDNTTVANGSGQVAILNWSLVHDNMGTCTGKTRPYIEGAQVYRSLSIGAPSGTTIFTMIFAAKPMAGNPVGCNSANEVIAYAQSTTSPTGPYFYKGIIMCGSEGSDGGEWTNQASVAVDPVTGRTIFAYHDGPHADGGGTGWPHRQVHLQCLKWTGINQIARIPRSSTNLSNC